MSAYSDKVIADGASQYWRLGEASGPTAFNSIGGLNGTISGGVTLGVPGAVVGDTAMTFNGTTGKILTTLNVTIPVVASVEAWFKTLVTAEVPILGRGPGGSGAELICGVSGGAAFMWSSGDVTSVAPVNDGQWHHVVYIVNNGTGSIYLNGVLSKTNAFTYATPSVRPLPIAWDQYSGFFTGTLDDVAIYPLALTPAQIANHYSLASAAATLTGDRTTAWSAHLKTLGVPKNEKEQAYLLGQGLKAGQNDLTTLLSGFLAQGNGGVASGGAGPMPVFKAAGTQVASTGSTTVGWPLGHAAGDFGLLLMESCGGEPMPATPSGWTPVAGSPQATGAGISGTQVTAYYRVAASASEPGTATGDPGDHVMAVIVTCTGVAASGLPWDVTTGGVKSVAAAGVSLPAVTTTVPNTLIVQVVTHNQDIGTPAFSAPVNAGLVNLTEQHDQSSAQGIGGGIGVITGQLAAAGSSGTTTLTVASSVNAMLTIALRG